MKKVLRSAILLASIFSFMVGCSQPAPTATSMPIPTETRTPLPAAPTAIPTDTPLPPSATPDTQTISAGAYSTGQYRNLFQELLGKSDNEIQAKLDATWEQLFYGADDSQRVYYPVGEDMAYIADIGSGDVRSEGMSYGMMIAVQMDKQEEFNRIWKWAKTYMYQSEGPYKGYFAWHCNWDGSQIDANPASDGEEWFAMALFFASARWGDGEGIFNYKAQAQEILDVMLHKSEEKNGQVTSMFDPASKQIVFVPTGEAAIFTDPSYHLPAFYELWALWADKDNDFWAESAQVSRDYFHKAAHPVTGLMPNYAEFDGTPRNDDYHKDFRFDAWRTLANVAVDYAWFAADPWQVEQSERVLDFLASQGVGSFANQFSLDGTPLSSDHSTGLVAMAASAGLAASPEKATPFVEAFWNARIPSGKWRYYDGMLYLLGLLYTSGRFQIYTPSLP
jgi:oligosaccharide reducing-end xylanase